MAKTLLEMAGADLAPAKLGESCLVFIDFQNEYLEGPVAVTGAISAVSNAETLLKAARDANTPVLHVAHKGKAGSLFDREAPRGQIIDNVAAGPDETVIEKVLPNAFAGTTLHDEIEKTGRKELIIAGFMTHMCVSSTARAALDLGYRVTIDSDSCGTRDLPGLGGDVLWAKIVHEVALAELADRFAIVAKGHDWTSV